MIKAALGILMIVLGVYGLCTLDGMVLVLCYLLACIGFVFLEESICKNN